MEDRPMTSTSASIPGPVSCSYLASLLGDQMIATATEATAWILLEHAGPWGVEPLPDAGFRPEVTAEIARRMAGTGVRVQLIAPPPGAEPGAAYVAGDAHDGRGAWLRRIPLGSPEDVLDLDFESISAGQRPAGTVVDEPFYIVCANDRNDPCCGRSGPPILDALAPMVGSRVRRTPHVGGHKYAGIVVAFPHGTFYGRLEPGSARETVAAHDQGHILLDKYRGRSAFGHAEQAAEYFLRREKGFTGVGDVHRAGLERPLPGGGGYEATFLAAGARWVVTVAGDQQRPPRRQSCADEEDTIPPAWRLVGITRADEREPVSGQADSVVAQRPAGLSPVAP